MTRMHRAVVLATAAAAVLWLGGCATSATSSPEPEPATPEVVVESAAPAPPLPDPEFEAPYSVEGFCEGVMAVAGVPLSRVHAETTEWGEAIICFASHPNFYQVMAFTSPDEPTATALGDKLGELDRLFDQDGTVRGLDGAVGQIDYDQDATATTGSIWVVLGTRVVSIDYIGQGQAIEESTVSERLLNIAVAGLWTPFPTGVP